MHIALTGGTGYLGSVLAPKLAKICSKLDILDLQPPVMGNLPKNVRFFQTDITDSASWKRTASQYDLIIHLAGLVGYPACQKEPREAVRRNLWTTRAVVKNARRDATLILASTISTYGPQKTRVNENTPTLPPSLYAKTKKRAEESILNTPKGIVFRLAGAFGLSPRMRDDLLIHEFTSKAAFNISTKIYEKHFIRQFIHIEDITDAFCFAVHYRDMMHGEIFNVGNPEIEINKERLVRELQQLAAWSVEWENQSFDLEKRNYPISFEKFSKLGFVPKRSLKNTLQELFNYYQGENDTQTAEGLNPRSA